MRRIAVLLGILLCMTAAWPAHAENGLSERDMRLARSAWRYFEANRNPHTGIIRATSGWDATTVWDVGSCLAGYVAAQRLGLVSQERFDREVGLLIYTMQTMPLYKGELPNWEYGSANGQMRDLWGYDSTRGAGYSALDIGRAMSWLRILAERHPHFQGEVDKVLKRWKFQRLVANGELHGARRAGSGENYWQEGRLGYEQYAAMGAAAWNVKAPRSLDFDNTAETVILGRTLNYDTRHLAFLTSEPFLLIAMEFGFRNDWMREVSDRIYRVQQRRFEVHGIPTALSEDALDRDPWFLYNSVVMDGRPWAVTTKDGFAYGHLRSLSTKAAFAFYAVYDDPYSHMLMDKVAGLVTENGVYAGIYERGEVNRSLNINTNGIVLESLLYVAEGRQAFLRRTPLAGIDAVDTPAPGSQAQATRAQTE